MSKFSFGFRKLSFLYLGIDFNRITIAIVTPKKQIPVRAKKENARLISRLFSDKSSTLQHNQQMFDNENVALLTQKDPKSGS